MNKKTFPIGLKNDGKNIIKKFNKLKKKSKMNGKL